MSWNGGRLSSMDDIRRVQTLRNRAMELRFQRDSLLLERQEKVRHIATLRSTILTELASFSNNLEGQKLPESRPRDLGQTFRDMARNAKHDVLSSLLKHAEELAVKTTARRRYADRRDEVDSEDYEVSEELHSRIFSTHRNLLAVFYWRQSLTRRMNVLREMGQLLRKSIQETCSGNARCLVEVEQVAACVGEVLAKSLVSGSAKVERLNRAKLLREFRSKLKQSTTEHVELRHRRIIRGLVESHLYRLALMQHVLEESIAQEQSRTLRDLVDGISAVQLQIKGAQKASEELHRRELGLLIRRSKLKASMQRGSSVVKRATAAPVLSGDAERDIFVRKRARVSELWGDGNHDSKHIIKLIFKVLETGSTDSAVQVMALEARRLVHAHDCLRLFSRNTADVEMISCCYRRVNKSANKAALDGLISVDTRSLLDVLALGVRSKISSTEWEIIVALHDHNDSVQKMHDVFQAHRRQEAAALKQQKKKKKPTIARSRELKG